MSFIAGSIVGNVILNTSGFLSGVGAMISAATQGGAGIQAAMMAALAVVEQAAVATFRTIVGEVQSAAAEFATIGNQAEKLGVSLAFLSALGPAAQQAGTDADELADVIKDLNEKMGLAAEGAETEVEQFKRLGITQAEVQATLGNTEAMFYRVADAVQAMPTAAQKTAAMAELLSDGGTKMIPIFNQGSAALRGFREESDALGATISDEAAEGGLAFGKLTSFIETAWKGIRNAVAEPILGAIADDAGGLEGTIIKISEAIRDMIPSALTAVTLVLDGILATVDLVLAGLESIGSLSDTLGFTDNFERNVRTVRDAGDMARNVITQVYATVNPTFNADDASTQIAAKIRPDLASAYAEQKQQVEDAARRALVARKTGGR